MKVKELMNPNVVSVSPHAKIIEAIDIMLTNNIRRLLVEGGMIVTIRDLVYAWERAEHSVSTVATKDLLFVDPDVDVVEAAKIMTARGVGSLLVGDGVKVTGIVTERDIIKALRAKSNTLAKDVMNADPLTCVRDETLSEVVDLMRERWTRHAFVVDGESVVGVLSVRDIARAMAARRDLRKTKVDEFMTLRVVSARPDDSLEKVRELMAVNNVGSVPVIDPNKGLVGAVGERDMLVALIVSSF